MFEAMVCLSSTLALVASEYRDWRFGASVFKQLASFAFIAAAVTWGALWSEYGQVMLVGLILCAIGDVLLIRRGQSIRFLLGLFAFLLGHVAYAVAFVRWGPDWGTVAIAAAVLVPISGGTLRWLWPHLPDQMRVPVVLYVVVISAMVATSFGAHRAGLTWLVPAGAALFAISDLSVARARFVSRGFINSAWGLPVYYFAQILLASTVAMLPAV